ncbi:MAG TPA: hypothetical protein VH760_02205 [Gaiellaceae bacterium]|jgi:hypothetical protein
MRIGVFFGAGYYLKYHATALRPLVERGHELVLARPEGAREVRVPKQLALADGVSTALYPHLRDDGLAHTIKVLRVTRDVARYGSPELRDAYANRRRAVRHLVRAVTGRRPAAGQDDLLPDLDPDAWATVSAVLADVERLIPPNRRLVDFFREQRLDAVVCISRVNFRGEEADVVKAARAAGVPCGISVYSWDNLSSKALLHEHPDRLFVWNDVQRDEAETLHGVAANRVVVTGAARFDPFFALSPSAPREELLRSLGLDPGAATVLYLGSSGFVSKREPELVEQWLAALRASGDERIRDANVVVRPHPGALDEPAWQGWRPAAERVVVPAVRKKSRQLFDHLWLSDAVVALNTSAEIEAAIVGRPVLTVDAGELAPGQEGSTHFRYLLAAHGGFVERARSLDEHVVQLERALAEDPLRDARSRFLASFVRPRGVERPVGPILAEAIEALARSIPAALGSAANGENVGRSAERREQLVDLADGA